MPSPGRTRLTRAWIVLIAAWVATGALFKLFWGTPGLLPAAVIDSGRNLGLDLGLTYNLAIGIELAIVAVALLKPRWGWILQVLLLLVFDLVLATQIAAGAENCGCFGSKFSMPPEAMLAIDSVLLLGLLAARPWSSLAEGPTPVLPIGVAAVMLALPWFLDREVQEGSVEVDGKPLTGQNWLELNVESWVGMDIWDTPLGKPPLSQYVDVNSLPLDGLWVLWRQTCDHCAKHLAHLAESEHGERLVTLLQLEEENDTLANRIVNAMPDGNFVQHASLPPSMVYLVQTPAELVLEGGRVVSAAQGVEDPTPGEE